MNRTLKVFLITVISFGLYFALDAVYFKAVRKGLNEIINQGGISHIIAYAIFGIPIILAVILIHNVKGLIGGLGLDKSFIKGVLFPLICTLPMLVGFAVVFNFNPEITVNDILIKVIAAAFFEELYFRGFLFGQLFRYTKLGFLPSVIIGALLFAIIHLYQSTDLTTLVGIFLTTLFGAILFAWAFAEWNDNLWIPVFLHLFMNLFWLLFSAGENALGGLYANVFRVLTILLIIGLTILYKKEKALRLR